MVTTTTTTSGPSTASGRESRTLILASNRGPIEHYFDQNGRMKRRASGGGVAVALAAAARNRRVSWIAGACSDADRRAARCSAAIPLGDDSALRLLPLPEEAARPFYNEFSNPLLWFIQHGLGDELRSREVAAAARRSWLSGYLPVNRLFADALISEIDRCGGRCRVMLHDYHLYLAPRLVRRSRPQALLQQFVHIPWPKPAEWSRLPTWIVREICGGLLANDSVVFQTEESVANFIETCETYLQAAVKASDFSSRLSYLGHSAHIWSNPISVDAAELAALSVQTAVGVELRRLQARAGEQTIVRVDRLDPSKNVLRGFQAYERLLRRRADLRGRVKFLAFLVPSRAGIPEYDDYARAVFAVVDSINARYGNSGWTPIEVFYQQDRLQAMAGLSLYDVLLVNSVADGMNLVSKEGPLVNRKNGVVCLSKAAGSYEQLRTSVVGFDPLSLDETSRALEAALELRPEVRRTLAEMCRSAIESHQLSDWLRHLMHDMELAAWRKEGEFVDA